MLWALPSLPSSALSVGVTAPTTGGPARLLGELNGDSSPDLQDMESQGKWMAPAPNALPGFTAPRTPIPKPTRMACVWSSIPILVRSLGGQGPPMHIWQPSLVQQVTRTFS